MHEKKEGCFLGLDLGTSMLKATVIHATGRILAFEAQEIPIDSPSSGWAEEDPDMWYSVFGDLLSRIHKKVSLKDIRAVGLSGQMHGLVTYRNDFKPVRPAIIWADKRSAKEVEEIKHSLSDRYIYKTTGNPLSTGFLLPSLLWIKKHEKDIYKSVAHISSPKDYISYRLTGNLRCESSDALATGCYDYLHDTWATEMLKKLTITPELFPSVISSTSPYGLITTQASQALNIPSGIPVYGGSDQSMAALGSGIVSNGQALIAISTGGQFLVCAEKGVLDKQMRLHTLNHAIPNRGLYMAATLSAGLSLKWLKNNIFQEKQASYDSYTKNIHTLPIGSNGLYYFPYICGERTPYFNPYLRGAFIGLSLEHNQNHLIRAVMEGVSFSFREGLEIFDQLHLQVSAITISGGGSKNPIWCQMTADTINKPVSTISIDDHSPYGAAVHALFSSEKYTIGQMKKFYTQNISVSHTYQPNKKNVTLYNKLFRNYRLHAQYLNTQYKST